MWPLTFLENSFGAFDWILAASILAEILDAFQPGHGIFPLFF
jgi:hypothetical protein